MAVIGATAVPVLQVLRHHGMHGLFLSWSFFITPGCTVHVHGKIKIIKLVLN